MSLALKAEPIPLAEDVDGVIRVGGSRVTLDTVIHAYRQGATPEQISADFSAVQLADVYTVIAYYLRHKNELDRYLERRRVEAERVQQKLETAFPARGLKERLEKRLAQKIESDAPTAR